tara:strand:- start:3020 stop:3937 length:918 start_codon:yes stop_codon:yes gene_type:complete
LTLPIYIIVGPTCIGKSSLAIKLAKKINAQIINADSMQVYSNLNILTARPSKKDEKDVTHHLYGHVNGSERYNVARWCYEASDVINDCKNKNISTIIVGGTGLYIEKLINGIFDIPPIPEKYKIESNNILEREGIKNFLKIVKECDGKAVEKINPNDVNRLKRIWEVYNFTNITLSDWKKNNLKKFLIDPKYFLYLFLPDRKVNYERVDQRFLNMIKNGAIKEVEELLNLNLDKSLPVMRAHGVPEITKYLNNQMNFDECIKKCQQITRNYVKRQNTWWNSNLLKIHQKFTKFPDQISLKSINFN